MQQTFILGLFVHEVYCKDVVFLVCESLRIELKSNGLIQRVGSWQAAVIIADCRAINQVLMRNFKHSARNLEDCQNGEPNIKFNRAGETLNKKSNVYI